MEASAVEIRKWEEIVAQAGGLAEIDIEADVHTISGRVLSMTAFGGDFEKGDLIYKTQKELAMELMKTIHDLKFWLIPFYRKIPTNQNRRIDEMLSKLDNLLHELIHGRLQAVRNKETSSFGNDLLGNMLTAATDGWEEQTPQFNLSSVLHNCKLFYFAGQDTVANTTMFTMLMLALRPEWQARARKEVLEILGDEENFNASALSRLKVVGMILNETMRTFSPVPSITRVAMKDLHLNNLFIPKGMTIEFATSALHQDKQYWGDDVGEYNPERFANGVSGACSHPQAFNPFGLGPRTCIGNGFAVMEMKIVLASVLRRFEILPSPNYKHHPIFSFVTRPKFGLPIVLKAR